MARGAQDQANKTYRESNQVYTGAQQNSSDLYKKLFPMLMQEATSPTGYDPTDLAAMNTAAQQSQGGATAAAVGDLGLQAARSGNAGGAAAAEDEAVRSGQRNLSQTALGIKGANADLKEKQKQLGIQGLGGLYGQNTGDMLSALGLQNQSTNTGIEAGKSGWFQNMTDMIRALNPTASFGGGGGASASIGHH